MLEAKHPVKERAVLLVTPRPWESCTTIRTSYLQRHCNHHKLIMYLCALSNSRSPKTMVSPLGQIPMQRQPIQKDSTTLEG